jgi:phosphatidylglycerol:prolipoprotein diacylglycerol transferase
VLPVLQLGPLALPVYPLSLLLALWAGLAVSAWAARQMGLDGDHIYNAGLYGLVAGLLVGRLAHVVAYWPAYRTQPAEIVGLNSRAFLLWPGVIAFLVIALWYVHRHRLPWKLMLDASAPGALAGLAVAALGALLAGRALGAAATLPWSVMFWGVARHPSQIYEAIAALIVAGLSAAAIVKRAAPGTAALIALLGYGLSRWLLEPFRAESTVTPGGLRLAQVAGMVAVIGALWALRRRSADDGRAGRP